MRTEHGTTDYGTRLAEPLLKGDGSQQHATSPMELMHVTSHPPTRDLPEAAIGPVPCLLFICCSTTHLRGKITGKSIVCLEGRKGFCFCLYPSVKTMNWKINELPGRTKSTSTFATTKKRNCYSEGSTNTSSFPSYLRGLQYARKGQSVVILTEV
ncbi:hypothetical protein AVEN_201917-1 [Araneus ventricosus]|uniref:Uncharacterized protein n=1 Tax=Araneus ventricosus TaxID=182803 RepID=A0A4Y2S2E1_ARAVE|nr:hypothetical protein AVEN_201917-1 [Araneus ventricosus]